MHLARSPSDSSLYTEWLSCAAPLMFAKLVTIFDMHKFFGILQIVVFRMLRSSSIFFALLAILGVGFAQALAGLGRWAPECGNHGPLAEHESGCRH